MKNDEGFGETLKKITIIVKIIWIITNMSKNDFKIIEIPKKLKNL